MKKVIFFVFLILPFYRAVSQDNSPYYIDGNYNKYVEYLINSGKIDITHPLNQPFTAGQLYNSLDTSGNLGEKNYWADLLKKDLKRYIPDDNPKGTLLFGINGEGSLYQDENNFDHNINGTVSGSYGYGNFLMWYGYTANTGYVDDTLYFGTTGKLQNSVYGRASTSYMKYTSKHFNIFYGRLNRNYGFQNSLSLIRSSNPFSYDHFSFSFFNRILKYSFSTTRLDDKYAYDIREDSIPQYDWYRRYISFHRLEISFSGNLKFAFSESILYGGKNDSPQPPYLNPVNLLFFAKMSDRKGFEEGRANAMTTFEVYARFLKKLSFYGQFLIDDMDFTKELREKYPDRVGFSSNITFTDIVPKSQIKLFYRRISNWTYNSFYTFGNYTFYGKSLGFPENGFENFGLEADIFSLSKVFFTTVIRYQRERKQDLETHFDPEKTKFPTGISQNTFGASVEINFIPSIYFSSSLGLEYLAINNYSHLSGNNKNFLNLYISLRANGVFSLLSNRK